MARSLTVLRNLGKPTAGSLTPQCLMLKWLGTQKTSLPCICLVGRSAVWISTSLGKDETLLESEIVLRSKTMATLTTTW